MRQETSTERSWNGRNLKLTLVDPEEQINRIRDTIALRAFQICERRGCGAGRGREDWQRAESELLAPLNCGHVIQDDKIWSSTDAAYFEKGDIEVCVEPRPLTLCGTPAKCTPLLTPENSGSQARKDFIFRTFELPVEIEPSQAAARFRGRFLEIDLPKARAMHTTRVEQNAA